MNKKKSHKFLEFLLKRDQKEEVVTAKRYKYIKMSCPIDRVLSNLNIVFEEIKDSDIFKNLKLEKLEPEKNGNDFIWVFNRTLLTGYDPYRPISEGDITKFPLDTTFIGYLYGKPVSFITCTVDQEDGESIGVIAGLGVIPEYRRRGVAKATIIKAAEILKNKFNVTKLVCDVYEKNVASYNLIKKFGFVEEEEFYI